MKNSKSTLFFTPGRNLLLQINRFACGELVHFCNLAVPSVSIESAVELLGHAHFRSDIAKINKGCSTFTSREASTKRQEKSCYNTLEGT